MRGGQSASVLSTILGSVFRAASCWGAGKHPGRGAEGVRRLRMAELGELCVLECSRAAAQGGGNTGTGDVGEELKK